MEIQGCLKNLVREISSLLALPLIFVFFWSARAQEDQLDSVRNNLSLPQIGLCILTSLSAVAGAILKGELRAESSHKDVLPIVYALYHNGTQLLVFTHERDLCNRSQELRCSFNTQKRLASPTVFSPMEDDRPGITLVSTSEQFSRDSRLWKFAKYLEQKLGYKGLIEWLEPVSPNIPHACLLVTAGKVRFLDKMIIAWFRFNCDYTVRIVAGKRGSGHCDHCVEIPGLAWPGVLRFIRWPTLVEVEDDHVVLTCAIHSEAGSSCPLGHALMSSLMGYTNSRKLGIMLIDVSRTTSDLEKRCLPRAYCSLDAAERNMLPQTAELLLSMREPLPEEEGGGLMEWSWARRMLALFVEVTTALFLCWAAQMPPLSASLVGRRLVRSHATGARGNTSVMACVGNRASVSFASRVVDFVEISSTITGAPIYWSLVASLELFLIFGGFMAQYACWALVLTGHIPVVFGTSPNPRWALAKACGASVILSLCMLMCILKNLEYPLHPLLLKSYLELPQASFIFFTWALSQVCTWLLYIYINHQMRVPLITCSSALFGEIMWLSSMWRGAHHDTMDDDVSWSRTASHVAPYFTDMGASLILAI